MKTFIFTKSKSSVRRTYGGENYTLQVYEVKSKNNIVHVGEVSRCSASHKGEISEAYTVVFNSLSKRKQNQIKRISKEDKNKTLGLTSYYSWSYTPELLGITLKEI